MTLPQFIFLLIEWVIYIGLFAVLSKILYFILLANIFRTLAGIVLVLSSLLSLVGGEWQISVALLGCSTEFLRRFYLYTNTYEFQNNKSHIDNVIGLILKPITLFLHGGMKVGQYAVSVIDGTVSAKAQLKRERGDFEDEKAWFKEEKRKVDEDREELNRAWEELQKEREEFERQRAGEKEYTKKDYSENKEYQKQKSKYERTQRKEEKKKTGRLFKEWADFNLKDIHKNDPYEVLGCKDGDDKSIIKKKYKDLCKIWMPDRFNQKPRSLEEKDEAMKIAQMINISYDAIVKKEKK